jgi:hypothetical protein
MKRLTAALLALAAIALFTIPANAATAYTYKWQWLNWGSDSSYFYIPVASGVVGVGTKSSSVMSIPENALWPAAADSMPIIVVGTLSGAQASGDTLNLHLQFTYDGTNFYPNPSYATSDLVLVGVGTYFSYRAVPLGGLSTAGTAMKCILGVPNTYSQLPYLMGATGLRVRIRGTQGGCTGNRTLRVKVGFPTRVTP